MIAVSLLGRVAVSVDGVPISGEAAQRRRLALLALLCIPAPRPVRRDRLMLYLWPDSDAESARHLLSVAVHVLRKAFGHEVLVSTPDEVALVPAALQVDVAGFEEAARLGDHELAVTLYGGPFMDGFHAGAGAELEQWVEEERARLQRSYAQALEGLAGQRRDAGNAAGAVEAWRQLAALDPYSSHGALGLMRALAESGNRAGAIRHAAVHRQLLAELEAEPDPEVEALAETLRAEPPPAGLTSPPARPPAAPPQEASVTAADETSSDGASSPGVAADDRPAAGAEERPARRPGRSLRARVLRSRRWLGAALAVVALVLAGYGTARRLAWNDHSVAVLPFSSIGAGGEYLGEGIAEQILNDLEGVAGLRVVAGSSSFQFRGGRTDVREIGRRLGVQWVVRGSVEPVGDSIRVAVELSRTRDGTRVWGDRYDRPFRDHIAIEDEVARKVASAIDRSVRGTVAERTSNPRAADLYMRGSQAWNQRTRESLRAAVRFFEQAVTEDTTYARAYAGLAQTLIVAGSYDYGVLPPDSAYPRARAAARRAIELDPRLAAGHAALASVYMDYDWKPALAEQEFREAIRVEPGYSPARQWYGLLLVSRRRDAEARRQMQIAGENDPTSPVLFVTRAQFYYYTRQYDRGLEELQRALELDPRFGTAHLMLALTQIQTGRALLAAERMQALGARSPEPVVMAVLGYARGRSGDRARAQECRQWLVRAARQRYVPAELLALVDVGLGDHDAAFADLEQARLRRSDGMVYVQVEPALDPLRSDPRFAALLREVGMRGPTLSLSGVMPRAGGITTAPAS